MVDVIADDRQQVPESALNPCSPYSEESQEGQREQARQKNDEYGPLFIHDRIILASSLGVAKTAGIWQARAKRPLRTFLRNPNPLVCRSSRQMSSVYIPGSSYRFLERGIRIPFTSKLYIEIQPDSILSLQ